MNPQEEIQFNFQEVTFYWNKIFFFFSDSDSSWFDWMFPTLFLWLLNSVICVGVLARLFIFGEPVVKKNSESAMSYLRHVTQGDIHLSRVCQHLLPEELEPSKKNKCSVVRPIIKLKVEWIHTWIGKKNNNTKNWYVLLHTEFYFFRFFFRDSCRKNDCFYYLKINQKNSCTHYINPWFNVGEQHTSVNHQLLCFFRQNIHGHQNSTERLWSVLVDPYQHQISICLLL